MRLCNNAILAAFLAAAALTLAAQTPPAQSAPQSSPAAAANEPAQAPPLTVDRDPVRSPDGQAPAAGPLRKQGQGYVLHANVEEVVLNCTVLQGAKLVQNLQKDDFQVYEDGVKQTLVSFQHTDLPVSIGAGGGQFRVHVAQAPRGEQERSGPDRSLESAGPGLCGEFFRRGLHRSGFHLRREQAARRVFAYRVAGRHCALRCGVASADKLVADAKRPKQVLILITDGEDNASTLDLEQTSAACRHLSGPVIYSIGLLFGDEMSRAEVRHARRALEMLSTETGGMAFFPKSIDQVDQIAAEVARDIRNQYTLGYHSTKPTSEPGFRIVEVTASAKGMGKLTVRTRTGYFPSPPAARQATAPAKVARRKCG